MDPTSNTSWILTSTTCTRLWARRGRTAGNAALGANVFDTDRSLARVLTEYGLSGPMPSPSQPPFSNTPSCWRSITTFSRSPATSIETGPDPPNQGAPTDEHVRQASSTDPPP
jgi:hypothetical protein